MTARVLDGAAIAREVLDGLAPRVEALVASGVRPGLATVVVGDNPASRLYVRNKVNACRQIGLHAEVRELDAGVSEDEIIATVATLNRDPAIHGIIVQLPLPESVNVQRVVQSIALAKDVDGFNWTNLGALLDGHAALAPCTPLGVMVLLAKTGESLQGRDAVVIGRSSLVGKPLALMLVQAGATVTVCHSKTKDLAAHTRRADILVAAAGRAGLVTADMVKENAVVIDVGINRRSDGKLVGDVDYDAVATKAAAITPVPGGVGRMTVAMLVSNTVLAAERAMGFSSATDSRTDTGARDSSGR